MMTSLLQHIVKPVRIAKVSDAEVLFEPVQSFIIDNHIVPAKCVVKVNEGKTSIKVLNPDATDIIIIINTWAKGCDPVMPGKYK